MLDRFHSKLHRYNHHTSVTPGVLDSASDPIAAPFDPFKGDFHVQGTLSAYNVEASTVVRIGVNGGNNASIFAPGLSAPRTFNHPNASGTYILDTTISPFVSSYFAANVGTIGFTNNTLWVDPLSGSNITGTRARSDKPFQTLAGAQAAASASDVIVVRPGVYTEVNLGKNQVDWYFQPGATIVGNAITTPFFTYSGKSYNVYGSGTFSVSGGVNLIGNNALVANFDGATGDNILFEFDRVIVDPSSTLVAVPLVAAFKGVYGNSVVTVAGNSIYAPKANVFSGVKSSTAGTQSFVVDVDSFIVGQTLFYDSLHNISGFVNSPVISATDYLYNDGGTVSAVNLISIDGESVYGSVLKNDTTGTIAVDTSVFSISPRVSTWSTAASGCVTINADNLTSNITLSTNSTTYIDVNSYSPISPALTGLNFSIAYAGTLTFKANIVSLTYTTTNYAVFYTNGTSSVLAATIGDVSNTPASAYNLVYVDSASASVVKLRADRLVNGGNLHLYGTNLKARIDIDNAPNTFIDVKALSASTDSVLYIEGLYKSLSSSNLKYTALSGQSGSKLYIPAGTAFQAPLSSYNLDLSAVVGTPLDVYLLGTVETNRTPVDVTANFTVNCGGFESTSALAVPTF